MGKLLIFIDHVGIFSVTGFYFPIRITILTFVVHVERNRWQDAGMSAEACSSESVFGNLNIKYVY